jgi:hypothetical protein
MPVPAKGFETSVRGSAWKAVVCENCDTEYLYQITREALGSSVSWLYLDQQGAQERATRRANAALRRMLEQGQDPVPCPACGWYQQSMIPLLRAAHRRGMILAGGFFVVIAVMFLLLWLGAHCWGDRKDAASPALYGETALWAANVGLGLILLRKLLSLRIYPNEGDPEERKRLGKSLARTRAEFEREQQRGQESP